MATEREVMKVEEVVRSGDTVKLLHESGGEVVVYEIIKATKRTGWEFGQSKGLTYTLGDNQLSTSSPLGKALLGRKVSETVMGYRIMEIMRGEKHVNHIDDITAQKLSSQDEELRKLYSELISHRWVRACIVEYRRYSYPVKQLKPRISPRYNDAFQEELMTEITISNIGAADEELIRIALELFSPFSYQADKAIANADMIVMPETIETLGLRMCSYEERYIRGGQYNILDTNAEFSFQPPALEARIDPETEQFICRRLDDRLEEYYLHLVNW